MKRRYLHRWTIWLLPFLLARALVPAGFMLSTDATGGLSIVFCSGILASASAETVSAESAHHHHHGAGNEAEATDPPAQQGGDNTVCAFALAGVASSYELSNVAHVPSHTEYSPLFASLLVPRTGPVRSELIRGPPALA
jgi:hypothetical protein